MLKRWINLPELGWYSGDVHTHHPLNKEQFRQYAMQLTKAEDLHLMNVLQMGDRSAVYFQPQGYGEKYHISEKDFCVVTGQEEPRSEYGHIIGLNIDTLARDTARYNYYDLVFDRLHQNPETLVGFAHFAYGGEGVIPGLAMYAPTGAIDFLELMQNTKINTADYYEYLNLGFRFSAAYGSDFPWGSTVGDGRVFVYTGKDFSAGKWFAGLKAGHSFVSNGPALFLEADHKIAGSELVKSANERTQVTIRALSSHAIGTIERIELHGSNGLIAKKKNIHKKEELGLTLNYPVKNSQWITAMVYCSNGAIAHTSPIYFVVDGQSTYNRIKGPGIIGKLTKILLKTRAAETGKPVPDTGILRRIDQAIGWYEQLLQKN